MYKIGLFLIPILFLGQHAFCIEPQEGFSSEGVELSEHQQPITLQQVGQLFQNFQNHQPVDYLLLRRAVDFVDQNYMLPGTLELTAEQLDMETRVRESLFFVPKEMDKIVIGQKPKARFGSIAYYILLMKNMTQKQRREYAGNLRTMILNNRFTIDPSGNARLVAGVLNDLNEHEKRACKSEKFCNIF